MSTNYNAMYNVPNDGNILRSWAIDHFDFLFWSGTNNIGGKSKSPRQEKGR